MKKIKIAKNNNKLSVGDKVLYYQSIITECRKPAALALFGGTEPAELTALETATDALDGDQQAQKVAFDASKAATANLAGSVTEADDAFDTFVNVADNKHGNVVANVKLMGMDVAGEAGPTPASVMLALPTGMHVTAGDNAGQLDLAADGRKGVRGWAWQVCTGDPSVAANWKDQGRSSGSNYRATGLVSGTRYWFRGAIIGTGQDNQSPWSDPATGIAP